MAIDDGSCKAGLLRPAVGQRALRSGATREFGWPDEKRVMSKTQTDRNGMRLTMCRMGISVSFSMLAIAQKKNRTDSMLE